MCEFLPFAVVFIYLAANDAKKRKQKQTENKMWKMRIVVVVAAATNNAINFE